MSSRQTYPHFIPVDRHPHAKIFYPVRYKKRAGALIATPESVAFYLDGNHGDQAIELEWEDVLRITANVANSPVALLKLVTNGHQQQTTVFQFDTREELLQAKSAFKAFWKSLHEESMRNFDDEDFSESKREEDDDLLFARSNNYYAQEQAAKRKGAAAAASRPRRASAGQNNTHNLPRINEAQGTSYFHQNYFAVKTESTSASTKEERHPDNNNKKVKVSQKPAAKSAVLDPRNHGFSKGSQIQLLPHDQILLPRNEQGQSFRLDFSNYGQTQGIKVAKIHHANGETGEIQLLKLEDFMNRDVEAQQPNNNNTNDDYRISKRVCVAGVMATTCGVAVVLLMAVAIVVLSILLWDQSNKNNNEGNINDNSGLTAVTDDFYSGYYDKFGNNP